ncbi:hypothetical protein ASPFODRAFT_55098, partial [Aspergillus luchuensis CBS 106.47]
PLIPSKPRPGFSRTGMSILRNAVHFPRGSDQLPAILHDFPPNDCQKVLPSRGLVVLAFVVIGTYRTSNKRNARGGC